VDAVGVATAGAVKEADVADAKNERKTIKVTYVRSAIGYSKDQKATIKALGFRRLNQTVELVDSPPVRGQIFKVKHMLKVEED
jgi:large subunit ribosomal protein L30